MTENISNPPAWPPRYDPGQVEDRIYRIWQENDCFKASPSGSAPYVIVIPPPNITGILTMGHVLNNTLQDILIRWQRMRGREALWLPGTDHAGIATQNAVEKHLDRERISRRELGREKRRYRLENVFGRDGIIGLYPELVDHGFEDGFEFFGSHLFLGR